MSVLRLDLKCLVQEIISMPLSLLCLLLDAALALRELSLRTTKDTEELRDFEFIDIRKLQPGGLSAGHDIIVLKYRDMLDSGADQLDERALTDFEATRADMAG